MASVLIRRSKGRAAGATHNEAQKNPLLTINTQAFISVTLVHKHQRMSPVYYNVHLIVVVLAVIPTGRVPTQYGKDFCPYSVF